MDENEIIQELYDLIPEDQREGTSIEDLRELLANPEGRKMAYENIPTLKETATYEQFDEAIAVVTNTPQFYEPTEKSGEEPAAQPAEEEEYVDQDANLMTEAPGEVLDLLGAGAARLNSWIARTPAYAYDVFIAPFANLASYALGGEGDEFSAKKLGEAMGISENKVAAYYENNAEKLRADFQEKYDKSLTEYFKNKDYDMFIGSLAGQVAESIPITLGIMATGAMGGGAGAVTAGGGLVFGAGEREELKDDPNMSEGQKNSVAMAKGLLEGLTENIGLGPMYGKMMKELIERYGVKEAQRVGKDVVEKAIKPSLRKYLGVAAAEAGGEMVNQIGANTIDKYAGNKPDIDIMDHVADSGLVGLASSLFFVSTMQFPAELAASRKERERLKQIEQEKQVVDQDLQQDVPENVKQTIREKGARLAEEENEILARQKEAIEALPEAQRNRVYELRQELNDFEQVLGESGLSDDAKAELQKRGATIQQEIDRIMGKSSKIQEGIDDVERRRQAELETARQDGNLNEIYAIGSDRTVEQAINEKYDAYLKVLKVLGASRPTQQPETTKFDFPDVNALPTDPMDFNLINSATGSEFTYEQVTPAEVVSQIQSEREKLTTLKDCL